MTSVTSTTSNAPKGWAADGIAYQVHSVIPDSLLVKATTHVGSIEGDAPAIRVPLVTSDPTSAFIPEGTAISVTDPVRSEVVINTGKIGVLHKVSREQWHQTEVGRLLSDSVRRELLKKANNALVAQAAPTPPAVTPPAGILNQSPTNGGAVTPTSYSSSDATLDLISDAIVQIEAAAGQATNILVNPTVWGRLLKFKSAASSNLPILGSGTQEAERYLHSVPVTVSSAVPANKLVVLDRGSVYSAYGAISVHRSEDYYFNEDVVALRATFRFGAKIANTAHVVEVTVNEPDDPEET